MSENRPPVQQTSENSTINRPQSGFVRNNRPAFGKPEQQPARPGFSGGSGRPAPSRFGNENRPRFGKPAPAKPTPPAPPTARAVALNTLQDVSRSDAFAALALDKRLRSVTLSDVDKAFCTQLVYGVLENRLALDYRLNLLLSEPERLPPLARDLLRLGAYQILFLDRVPDHSACDETVKLAKLYPSGTSYVALVNATLRRLSEKKNLMFQWPDDPMDAMAITLGWPRWILERLIATYGEEESRRMIAACSWRAQSPGISIRINTQKTDAPTFEKRLELRDCKWRRGLIPGSYVVEGLGSIGEDPDFRQGLFSVEGTSSMLAADTVGVKPGMRILDACAAPGGKTAYMAERMNQAGRIFAVDKYPHRVELIRAQIQRLGLENIKLIERDMTTPNGEWQQYFDAVLIDAPCSGLGVAADKPDLRYRLTPESVEEMTQVQGELLDNCAAYVKQGGVLVYATCSILPEENVKQIQSFLARHKEFRMDTKPLDSLKRLPEFTPGEFGLQLLPQKLGGEDGAEPMWIEGFFVARMIRARGGIY